MKLEELDKEEFTLRFKLTMGDTEDPMRIRSVRKDIARIKTILKEKDLGL